MRFVSAESDMRGHEVFVRTEVGPSSQGPLVIYCNQANFNASAQILYYPPQPRRRPLGGILISPQLTPVNYKGRRRSIVATNPPKRRSRRPNTRPILRPNNIHGRRGKRRCLQCRIWKQKCEYEDVGLPCTLCSKKGFACGAEHKSMPAKSNSEMPLTDDQIEVIPRPPQIPSDQTISAFEEQYMQFYWCTSGMWFDLTNDVMTDSKHPLACCAARRFGLHISSKPVRSAVLYYSSFRKEGGETSCLRMEYLAQFCESAREAIAKESYVELLYACYAMCSYEMAAKRLFSEDFEKHAHGFLISYENLMKTDALIGEEYKVMSQAYDMISGATEITSSRWHQEENWFEFAETCIQRIDNAAFRVLNSPQAMAQGNDYSTWLPKSHHLFEAERYVYELCTLFERFSWITRNLSIEFEWIQTAADIQFYLNTLLRFISTPPILESSVLPNVYLLKDGRTTVPGDKFTRQLLCLYYIFELQYQILIREWSDTTRLEVVQTSLAICRLFPAPHESTYPGPEIRFIVHRGLYFAGVTAVEGRNIGVNTDIRSKLAYAFTVPRGSVK